jgi:hypothetical protein
VVDARAGAAEVLVALGDDACGSAACCGLQPTATITPSKAMTTAGRRLMHFMSAS